MLIQRNSRDLCKLDAASGQVRPLIFDAVHGAPHGLILLSVNHFPSKPRQLCSACSHRFIHHPAQHDPLPLLTRPVHRHAAAFPPPFSASKPLMQYRCVNMAPDQQV